MDSNLRRSAEQICSQVYAETRAFYADKAPLLGGVALGFQILCGQPIIQAPLLFLGYQPGGRCSDADEMTGWPIKFEHAEEDWRLAKRVREIWDVQTLRCCTGLNAIFFRSPSMRDWSRVDRSLRNEIENFSCARAEQIVRALVPQCLIIIGLTTFNRFLKGDIVLRHEGRVLVRSARLWGAPAYGVIHLSGARISRDEREQIKDYFFQASVTPVAR